LIPAAVRAILPRMRTLLLASLLLLPAAGLAADAADAEDPIAELRAKIARLETERDAAMVRANTYVLPKDKLEVQAKEKEIDEARAKLDELEKAGG
jgi:hypothetical protein